VPAVRANQKDLYYLAQLTERIEDVSRSLLGTLILIPSVRRKQHL
jgi:hypothetical protein